MKKREKFKNCIWNIFSSGLPVNYDIEGLRKVLLINLIILLASATTIVLGIIEFIIGDYILCFVNSFLFLLLVGFLIYLRKTKNYHLISILGTTVAGFFYTFLIAHGGIGNTTYMWLFTYPLIAIFLLGIRKGTVCSLLLLIMACLVFTFGSRIDFFTSYSSFVKMRFIPAYILIYFLALVMEKTREMSQEKMNQSEVRFRELFTNAPIPLVNATLDGTVIKLNNRFTRVLGYTSDDMPDIDQWWNTAYPDPEYRKQVASRWEKGVSNAVAGNSSVEPGEFNVTCKNGKVLTMVIGGNVIGGNLTGQFF